MGKAFRFASVEEGRNIATRMDEFIERINPAERSLKMGVSRFVSEDEYISFLEDSIMPWSFKEIAAIGNVVLKLSEVISRFNLVLDEDVYLIKTSGKEEWDSAYTRGNGIFLPATKIESYGSEELFKLLAHKFCHILLRTKKDLQKQLYEVIGFHLTEEIILERGLLERKVTNPDTPCLNSYIEVLYRNEKVKFSPISLLKDEISSVNLKEGMANNIEQKFVAVDYISNRWITKSINGSPLLIDVNDIKKFIKKIELNTQNIINPDEIIAESFAQLLLSSAELTSLEIVDEFKKIIS